MIPSLSTIYDSNQYLYLYTLFLLGNAKCNSKNRHYCRFHKVYPAFFLVALTFKPFVDRIILKYPPQLKSRKGASL